MDFGLHATLGFCMAVSREMVSPCVIRSDRRDSESRSGRERTQVVGRGLTRDGVMDRTAGAKGDRATQLRLVRGYGQSRAVESGTALLQSQEPVSTFTSSSAPTKT